MKGIEISKSFYNEYGKPMLENQFADILPYLAVGFVGSGSERFGFDDEFSCDHDYEVGFAIFLPSEEIIDSKKEFLLERAYAKLPKEYMGIKRENLLPVGGQRNGVIRTADFYYGKIGSLDGNLSLSEWLTIPDYAFSEATNGEVFFDGYGEFTKIRNALLTPPEDILRKRIAGNLLAMAQSGQYNFLRCVKRGELEASVFAVNEFLSSAIKVLYLLNGKFAPYYKWCFKGLKEIEDEKLVKNLSLIALEQVGDGKKKALLIEQVSEKIIEKLVKLNLSKEGSNDLEKHAYSVNDGIKDGEIRNVNIFVSVK